MDPFLTCFGYLKPFGSAKRVRLMKVLQNVIAMREWSVFADRMDFKDSCIVIKQLME